MVDSNIYKDWLEALKAVALFDEIDQAELKYMLSCLAPNIKSYKKNECIKNQGDQLKGIGIVLDGEVIVTKEDAAGNRLIMSSIEAGNMFGEIMAFSNINKWTATVIAKADCTILFLPSDKIVGTCQKICPGHKKLIQNMLKIVSQKAFYLNKKVEYLALKSIRMKISTYLLEQYKSKGNLSFVIPLKRNDLADFLSVTRPSISRELGKMKDEGIIDFDKSSFKILDLDALKHSIN